MQRLHGTFSRRLRVLAWGLLAMTPALAQLDPRLQASPTDFLDLYQPSSALVPKPEILSVFDFSRSMASLMYHPLYRNDDLQDKDDYRLMKVALTGDGAPNNIFTLTAKANHCTNASVSYTVTVTSATSATGSAGPAMATPACVSSVSSVEFTASAAACSGASTMIVFKALNPTMAGTNWYLDSASCTNTGPSYCPATDTSHPYTMTNSNGVYAVPGIQVTASSNGSLTGPWPPNTQLTLTAYLKHPKNNENDTSANRDITWSPYTGTSTVYSSTDDSFSWRTMTWTVPYSTPNGAGATQLGAITVSPAPPWTPGTVLTFTVPVISNLSNSISDWMFNQSGYSCSSTMPYGTTAWTATWTVPSYCTDWGTIVATVTLDASQGANYTVPGLTYPGVLTGYSNHFNEHYRVLRKPDGTPVTKDDADAAATNSGLYGAQAGRHDVRNWIRAASHARFFIPPNRTIDIPIPWKIMDRESTGNPCTSKTTLDSVTQSGVTYGSGLAIEADLNYRVNTGAGNVFAANQYGANLADASSSTWGQTTAYLYSTIYRPAYIAWLLNGKYQGTNESSPNYTTDASLIGKYIAFDAMEKSNVAGQTTSNWGKSFGLAGTAWGSITVPTYAADGTYTGTTSADASKYRTPALTRLQATKQAAIQAWINNQHKVYWAFRTLDPAGEANSDGLKSTINNDSTTNKNASNATTTHVDGSDSGWTVLNGNSLTGMQRIAGLFASGGTPLTYAMARSLAQYADPTSVFNVVEPMADVSQCANPFLLLFSDGQDNNGTDSNNANLTTPYLTGTGDNEALNIVGGNQAILLDKTKINRSGEWWNLFTLAGIGAHLADASLGTANTDYMPTPADYPPSHTDSAPAAYLPFAIKKRNNVAYNQDHRVTTMTLGVSLAGTYKQALSPKRSLFLAAALGDPGTTSGTLASLHPFTAADWIPDLNNPSNGRRMPGAVYFFDATDPDKLTTALDYAFRIATSITGNQATASPNLPFVGASFGSQIYIGRFMPPSTGGVLWPGDLLMFGLRDSSGSIQVLGNDGNPASVLDATTAHWSASAALASGPVGTARSLWTRTPGGTVLTRFTATGTAFTDANTGLKNYVATGVSDLAAKKLAIHHAAGGDITNLSSSTGLPLTNRSNIMGDIINSAPAALEYKWSYVSQGLSGFTTLSNFVGGSRFRLVLVGTNQGWLHAFGEVTKTNATTGLVSGVVQELWSFMPTDFLANLNDLTVSTNSHRALVDGSPALYHLDLPLANGGSGNGVVDAGERAIVIIGLGKGGRSFYALNIQDPFNPTLQWSWVPDEADSLTADRIITDGPTLTTVKGVLKDSGFSTATPAFGRVQDPAGILRDAVFLAGGFSVPEVEANFEGVRLGRSVTALDAYTGQVLATVDLKTDPASFGNPLVGPISAGVIPFEFVLNSGMAQRAYFTDYRGGLWAWGSREVVTTAPYVNFRRDTSQIQSWNLRKVYQDNNDGAGARYTTLPAPFRVGTFPGVGQSGSTTPAAVGVALISGDRNNPLDRFYNNAISNKVAPGQHRLTVVFDRQDSRAWDFDTPSAADTGISTSDLKNFSANSVSSIPADPCNADVFKFITQGCANYYLAPYQVNLTGGITPLRPSFGYYVNLEAAPTPPTGTNNGLIPKGINPPLVVGGSLFYSQFKPTASDPCTGGRGITTSYAIYDVLNPIVSDTRTGIASQSGLFATWVGVASNLLSLGGRGVLQGGMKEVANSSGSTSTLSLATAQLAPSQRYPKPLVWRTVH